MTNSLTPILFSLSLFFILLCLALVAFILSNNKKKRAKVEKMVERLKHAREKRKEQFSVISAITENHPQLITKSDKKERFFYEFITQSVSNSDLSGVDNIPLYLDGLLSPYFELLKLLADSSSGIEQSDIDALEKRYKEKIDENEELTQKISTLNAQKSEGTVSSADTGSDAYDLIKTMLTDIAKLTEEKLSKDELSALTKMDEKYRYLLVKLEDLAYKFNDDDDDFDQNAALIEQLRFEKVEMNKRYRKTMVLLTKVYGEYAAAFDLDPIEGDNLEIEDFEKIINEKEESS